MAESYSIHSTPLRNLRYPSEHFGVGLLDAAHVVAEAVLVQLFAGFLVPEAAGVGGDLICQHEVALGVPPGLYLEVHERYAALIEEGREDLVDLETQLLAELEVLVGDAQLAEVVPVEQGIAEVVVLVAQLHYRGPELAALLEAEQAAQRTGGDVADHDLDGQHVQPLRRYGGLVHLLDEVGRDAVCFEVGEDRRAHGRVGLALVLPRPALLRVERRRIILVTVQQNALVVRSKDLLGLAFVQQIFSHPPTSFSVPRPDQRPRPGCAGRSLGRRVRPTRLRDALEPLRPSPTNL